MKSAIGTSLVLTPCLSNDSLIQRRCLNFEVRNRSEDRHPFSNARLTTCLPSNDFRVCVTHTIPNRFFFFGECQTGADPDQLAKLSLFFSPSSSSEITSCVDAVPTLTHLTHPVRQSSAKRILTRRLNCPKDAKMREIAKKIGEFCFYCSASCLGLVWRSRVDSRKKKTQFCGGAFCA